MCICLYLPEQGFCTDGRMTQAGVHCNRFELKVQASSIFSPLSSLPRLVCQMTSSLVFMIHISVTCWSSCAYNLFLLCQFRHFLLLWVFQQHTVPQVPASLLVRKILTKCCKEYITDDQVNLMLDEYFMDIITYLTNVSVVVHLVSSLACWQALDYYTNEFLTSLYFWHKRNYSAYCTISTVII